MSKCGHTSIAEMLSCAKCGEVMARQQRANIAPASPDGRREQRIAFLERKREAHKTDLQLKFEDGDWHGVADAAMDLRDVDCELAGLRY